MRRHWRKTTIAVAGVALIASAVTSTASATTEPPPGTEPAGTQPAGSAPAGDLFLSYDESATCGTETNTSNIAKLEAPDPFTVVFTMCAPDVALPSKVAFSALNIAPSEYLENTDGLINSPIGTGPYMLNTWERGNQIVLDANPDYWGEPALSPTAVFQWNAEGAQRLVQLESGAADGIDNVGTDDFERVQSNPDLQLLEREPLNVFYVGFNVDMPPFDDQEVRQAIATAIDRQRIVDNFYPAGSMAADQFMPPGLPQYEQGRPAPTVDVEAARQIIAEKFPDGLDVTLSYRDVQRGYLAEPTPVATDIQAQLAEIGVNVTLDVQESGTFIDNSNAGELPFFMLGWGADWPDATNFMDFHFGAGAPPTFGTGFSDVHELLTEAGSITDEAQRLELYAQANDLLAEYVPMFPVAYGGSGLAFKAPVTGAHASPLGNESLAVMGIEGQGQFVFVQNGEPSGLYCPDETDGEALRVCEQIQESLLAYEIGGTESVPSLAESWESNEDLTVWTFHLREGVTFHDGSEFDATDVIESYRVQWDAADPRHVGREGNFTYFSALFGGFLNPPPPAEE